MKVLKIFSLVVIVSLFATHIILKDNEEVVSIDLIPIIEEKEFIVDDISDIIDEEEKPGSTSNKIIESNNSSNKSSSSNKPSNSNPSTSESASNNNSNNNPANYINETTMFAWEQPLLQFRLSEYKTKEATENACNDYGKANASLWWCYEIINTEGQFIGYRIALSELDYGN